MNNYQKFLRGLSNGVKLSCGLPIDDNLRPRQYGQVFSSLLMFFVRWLAVSSIAFGVFRYAEKVIEWACK